MTCYSTMFLVMLAICNIAFAISPTGKSDDDSVPSVYNEKEDALDLLDKLKKSFEYEFSAELAEHLKGVPEYNPENKENEYEFTTLLIDTLFDDIDKKLLENSGQEDGSWENNIAVEAISRWKISKESLSKISDLIETEKKKNSAKPEEFLKSVKNVIKQELKKAEKAVKGGNISEFIREEDMFDGEDDFLDGPVMM